MKQFTVQCSRCGKRKRVRMDNFVNTAYLWKSGGSTLICQKCASGCRVVGSTMDTVANMVRWMFDASEAERKGYE